MKLLAEPLGRGRRMTLVAGAIFIATMLVLAVAARAHATETVYWDNYEAKPQTIAFANIDGNGGGVLNTSGVPVDNPEGMAYDPANGRVYVASSANDQILWASVDGSGSGVLDTSGAKVENPEGIAVDPVTQRVYWVNHMTVGSIAYASAGGGGGGVLNTAGASTENPYKVALDTVHGRIYWVAGTGNEVFYAETNGTGGHSLNVSAGERPKNWGAINVDPAAGRLYFIGNTQTVDDTVYYINTSGVGGGVVGVGGSTYEDPYGMAFDPTTSRFYWGNYGNDEVRTGAIGTTTLAGAGGGINIATAPLAGPGDPLILKSPTGTAAPAVTQNVTALSCSQGSWSQDYPGSYVYGAPVSYAYQWLLNGAAIPGATAATYTATTAGSYSCTVTGTNPTGSGSQTSGAVTVTPATLALTLQTKKPKAKAGKTAKVKLKVSNSGQITSPKVKVCAKLTKKAKEGLKAPKCASIKALGFGGKAVATLKVPTKKNADGVYKFTTQVKGAKVKSVKVSVKVTAAKKAKQQKK